MEVKGVPALTRILPANATIDDRIELSYEQIDELKQQKICYDGMIRERVKIIKQLEKLKKSKGKSVRLSLMEALVGKSGIGRNRRKISKKKSKKKTKKRKSRK